MLYFHCTGVQWVFKEDQMVQDEIWEWMLKYQEERGMPPKMDEIQAAQPTLNWRSSVKHHMGNLIAGGRVITVDVPRSARRYRAVPDPAGTDMTITFDPAPNPDRVVALVVGAETLRD
jgi:hypothetical protein